MLNKTGFTDEDDWAILPRENSWADEYNLVFVDQPIDTGFSSADTIPQNMTRASEDFRAFL